MLPDTLRACCAPDGKKEEKHYATPLGIIPAVRFLHTSFLSYQKQEHILLQSITPAAPVAPLQLREMNPWREDTEGRARCRAFRRGHSPPPSLVPVRAARSATGPDGGRRPFRERGKK